VIKLYIFLTVVSEIGVFRGSGGTHVRDHWGLICVYSILNLYSQLHLVKYNSEMQYQCKTGYIIPQYSEINLCSFTVLNIALWYTLVQTYNTVVIMRRPGVLVYGIFLKKCEKGIQNNQLFLLHDNSLMTIGSFLLCVTYSKFT